MNTRKIKKVNKSHATSEGAGVSLKRAFGYNDKPLFDPFLMLDDFRNDDPKQYLRGFPWHPHRGIETITYVLEGDIEHADSLGNKGILSDGDVQWMTAGSGIIHHEMPKGSKNGNMYGFQLWANLPATNKMMPPRYQDIKSSQIPELKLEDGTLMKIICGTVNGVSGPVKDIVIDPEYLDITVPQRITFTHKTKNEHTVFVYVIEGNGFFSEDKKTVFKNGDLVLFENGDQIKVITENSSVRFLLISGMPLNESIAWSGPIVMNTNEELQKAFEEFENGTFIKK